MKESTMQRVLSGTRSTSKLHLGNYMGALANWVDLQKNHDCLFMIADWHALTTEYEDSSQLQNNILEVLKDYLACGIDPDQSIIFKQSDVKQHAELYLLLSMLTPVAWLERNPTYKEMMEQLSSKDLRTLGFLGYPVLQTADIVLYRANKVPVGQDQLPHLELGREIVRRFHFLTQTEVFPEPEAILTPTSKLPGTDGRKMSKSYQNCIYLSDSPDVMHKKIKTMMTDPQRVKKTDPGDPNKCPVFDMHRIFTSDTKPIIEGCQKATIGCIDCKKQLSSNMQTIFEPIYDKRVFLDQHPDILKDVLNDGSQKAAVIAEETMELTRNALGL